MKLPDLIKNRIILKYHPPSKKNDGMLNEVGMDDINTFGTRCYQASKMAILELYLDAMGGIYNISFPEFVLMLASRKKSFGSCEFELVEDNLMFQSADDIIKQTLEMDERNREWIQKYPSFLTSVFIELKNSTK